MSESAARAAAPSYVRTAHGPFLRSLAVDRALVRHDLAGSVAHVGMLARVGLITDAESTALTGGLRRIAREVRDGSFPWRDDLEDVHTNVEVRLSEIVGPVGGKLHTGRSRNDQIALDERLYLREAVARVVRGVLRTQDALLDQAERGVDLPMPGYTHLQRAQPVTVGHWLLAHFWRLDRDLDRLFSTARRSDVSPLGAGALAGSTLPIDPSRTATALGFAAVFENSLDAVSDRDALAELLFDLSLLAVHLSALGDEVVLFASAEFGFVRRTGALGSGSSQMPQKRNPDVAELVRGKAGRVVGDLVALLTTLKGLPLAYNRDLQEDKAPVLDAVATVTESLEALAPLVTALEFEPAALRAAVLDPGLYATDRAEELVRSGTAFREAHETLATGTGASGAVGAPIDPVQAVARRASPGGPAPAAVRIQIVHARAGRAERAASLSSLDRKVGLVEELLNEATTT
jgi:argininosuccinate lyase